MTNYNERLDEIARDAYRGEIDWIHDQLDGTSFIGESLGVVEKNVVDTKQAIISLIKELVAEARTDELKHLVNDDGVWHQDMTRKFPQKIRLEERIKELEKFEQNLLKALEEK